MHDGGVRAPDRPFENSDKSGKCPVCGGKVMDKVDVSEGSVRHSMTSGGLHCTHCGIKFEFMPPDL